MEPYKFMERKLRGKQSPSEILQFNQDPGKPNIGCKPVLEMEIEALRKQIRNSVSNVALLSKIARNRAKFSLTLLENLQDSNKKLRDLKILEAEKVYLKNML